MLNKFEVDFAAVQDCERADLWADTVRPLSFVTPLGGDPCRKAIIARGWMLDRLMLCEGSFGAQFTHRCPRRHATQAPEALVVQTYLRGAFDGEIVGEPLTIRVGEVNITDYSRGHRGRSAPTHVRSLVVAHDLVDYCPSRHPPTIRFSGETVFGRVLRHMLLSVHAELDLMTADDAPRVANSLIALLKGIIHGDAETARRTKSFAAARTHAIRAHVDERIGVERLTPDVIAARFNVSRATLYRDFKEEGGIEQFIKDRRLEAALTTLSTGPAERGAVTRAARRWGFSSTGHFSREFRSRFKVAPSDVVGGGRRADFDGVSPPLSPQSGHGDALEGFLSRL